LLSINQFHTYVSAPYSSVGLQAELPSVYLARSPSMASFESSYEKRQQTNGRGLGSVRFGGASGAASGAAYGVPHSAPAGGPRQPTQQPQLSTKPPRLRNIATGRGGGGGSKIISDLEPAPRESSLEWKSSREVLGKWGL